MTEAHQGWWRSIITPQTILTGIFAIFAAGGYWQDMRHLKERVTRLEERIDKEAVNNTLIYMRRDVLAEQLRLIQEEQTRTREALQLLRRDLQ